MNDVAQIIADLVRAGTDPELIGRVAATIVDARQVEPVKSGAARRQAAYRLRLGLTAPEWERVRVEVLNRDNWECGYCGNFGDTVDHIVPLSKGGDSELENLIAACSLCNRTKKDMDAAEFKEGRK